MLPSDSVCPYTETATGEPRSTPRKVSKETETPKNQKVIGEREAAQVSEISYLL